MTEDKLPVMESFFSLQGEGFHAGTSAFFLRLAGCDVGCHWCDVKESWNFEEWQLRTLRSICEEVVRYNMLIVVTGGEPLMYDLSKLTHNLKATNHPLHLETSGVYPLTGEWDWITFSPKKNKKPLQVFFQKSDEIKLVIHNISDLRLITSYEERIENPRMKRYLQPEWSRLDKMSHLIVEFVKKNPQWKISLQTHKYLGIR